MKKTQFFRNMRKAVRPEKHHLIYALKIILIAFILLLTLTGCKESSKPCNLSKGIDAILSNYIDRHSKDSVIIMQFYGVENRMILNIQHSPCYPIKEVVDGCFIYKNRLISYCILDKHILVDSFIDSTFASNKTILNDYKSLEDFEDIVDCDPDSECYLLKSQDTIVKAMDSDLKFKEIATDTIGIRNEMINGIINQRLNSYNANIIAIRFGSLENSDFFIVNEVNVYTKKSLSGCLRRNGRIIVLYGVDKLHNQDLIDRRLIHRELSQLDYYKEISSNWFNYLLSNGDIFKILPKGNIEKVSYEELPEEKSEMLNKMFKF